MMARACCRSSSCWCCSRRPPGAHPRRRARRRAGGAGATPAETIALRTRYFGAENVDPRTGAVRRDRVIMSWFGVTNFAMAIRGHVVLLDAWVPRGAHSGYVPSSPRELAALRPEAIFIGHAHFDHAADAVPIAQASGATIVGSAEQCAELRGRAPTMPPRCVEALPAGAAPGTAAEVHALRGVKARIVKHLHSAAKGPGGGRDGLPRARHAAAVDDAARPPAHARGHGPPRRPRAGRRGRHRALPLRGRRLLLRLERLRRPARRRRARGFETLRALRPVDLQVGAIQGFNQITNGMRDPRQYIEAIRPACSCPPTTTTGSRGSRRRARTTARRLTTSCEDPGRAAPGRALHRRPHRLRPPAGPHLPGPPRPGPPRAQLRRRRAAARRAARRPRRRRRGLGPPRRMTARAGRRRRVRPRRAAPRAGPRRAPVPRA